MFRPRRDAPPATVPVDVEGRQFRMPEGASAAKPAATHTGASAKAATAAALRLGNIWDQKSARCKSA